MKTDMEIAWKEHEIHDFQNMQISYYNGENLFHELHIRTLSDKKSVPWLDIMQNF